MKACYGDDLIYNTGSVPVEFQLLFDQRTGCLATPDGVLVIGISLSVARSDNSAEYSRFTRTVVGGNYTNVCSNWSPAASNRYPDAAFAIKSKTTEISGRYFQIWGICRCHFGIYAKQGLNLMNHNFSVFFAIAALLSACGTMNSAKLDNRDFAVDTYYPASNEIRLAENRARQYWQKNSGRFGAEPRYLAVEASSLLAPELSAEFSIKLDHSETSGAYFTQGISSSSKQGVSGVLIFDTQTDRSVGPQGYIIVDIPSRGRVVRVSDYTARYIGAGG